MDSTAPLFGAVAMWGYGVAAAGFGAFAIQLAFASRGAKRGRMVLAAVWFSAAWAACAAIYAYSGGYQPYRVVAGFADACRVVAWCAFLISLLSAHSRPNRLAWKSP